MILGVQIGTTEYDVPLDMPTDVDHLTRVLAYCTREALGRLAAGIFDREAVDAVVTVAIQDHIPELRGAVLTIDYGPFTEPELEMIPL